MLAMKSVHDFKETLEKSSTLCVSSSCRHLGLLPDRLAVLMEGLLPQRTNSLRGGTAAILFTGQNQQLSQFLQYWRWAIICWCRGLPIISCSLIFSSSKSFLKSKCCFSLQHQWFFKNNSVQLCLEGYLWTSEKYVWLQAKPLNQLPCGPGRLTRAFKCWFGPSEPWEY